MLGTAAYLSPEQARGEEAGPPSDIYSLGVCAYQFLAGRLPHEYSSLTELALKQQQDEVEPIASCRPEVPPALDRAIRLCLQREPAARYASALEFAQALEAGLHGECTEATARARVAASTRMPRGRWTTDRGHPGAAAHARARRAAPPRRCRRRRARTAARPPARAGGAGAPARQLGTFLALLAVLLAAAAVAIAAHLATDDGGEVQPVDAGDVREQIQDLKRVPARATSPAVGRVAGQHAPPRAPRSGPPRSPPAARASAPP